jgi:hypothetical protein
MVSDARGMTVNKDFLWVDFTLQDSKNPNENIKIFSFPLLKIA